MTRKTPSLPALMRLEPRHLLAPLCPDCARAELRETQCRGVWYQGGPDRRPALAHVCKKSRHGDRERCEGACGRLTRKELVGRLEATMRPERPFDDPTL